MLNQPFKQYLVSNSPAILAQGSTVENIAIGQIGIINAKTQTAVTSPTYATVKAIEIVQGTPDTSHLGLMSGVPNENEYSKLIKGKLIKNFKVKHAKRGRNQIITVGNSGDVSDTDTISAKPGDLKYFYLKATGPIIDKLYTTQGVIRQYFIDGGCIDDCVDTCTDVFDKRPFAESLARQINTDPTWGQGKNRFVKASVITNCSPALPDEDTVNCYRWEVKICDTRDDIATGIVQAQYTTEKVTRVRTEGSLSVYEIISSSGSTPTAVSNAGFILIPDCDTCPSGYTLTTGKKVYQVKRADAGSSGNLTTVKSDYGIVSPETGVRLIYEGGVSTYILTSTTALTVSGVDQLTFIGDALNSCVISTPTTATWALAETLVKYPKLYRLTIADDICGDTRLADIQAALPDNVVTLVDADGDCVHTYETTQYSQCVSTGCSVDTLVISAPAPFENATWTAVAATALDEDYTCYVGVKIEVAYVNRLTGECTYDYFPYESDTVHLQASNFDPNYNNPPDACSTVWPVKEIQSYQHPAGYGAHIRKLEEQSKSYALRERSFDPVVRELEGYAFNAVPDKYYDEYIIDFDFKYQVGGWSEKYEDSYSLSVFFVEGNGVAFKNAMNAYIASTGIELDAVI